MKHYLLSLLCLLMSMTAFSNTTKSVTQVTTPVTITEDWDYRIDSTTPFAEEGKIDIQNTDHAVVIFNNLKPSQAISFLRYITINGVRAAYNSNCQVKMYGSGAIVLPYGTSVKMLTVYSGKDFTGESCNDFDLRNDGGYMNTLTEEQLNNRIQSFKLKRGYMVTFSLREGGRGYSRCFIAANGDLEMNLPALMANRVSSYRIFQWFDSSKKGIASTTDATVINALNAAWCYDWGLGTNRLPDCESVVNHIYEDYPTSSECGKVTYATHMKTNNEPENSADDKPQSLETILANWENLMRTGMRLCTPSSWDGSPNFIKNFLSAIDARGWRCDLVDLHCYWTEDTYYTIPSLYNQYKRPIWISEFVWGASWNKNGAFASGVTEHQNAETMKRIINQLNNWGYVERYAYWNSEVYPSKVYRDGSLSELGEWYASQKTGIGYNKSYEFVPTTPPMSDPDNIAVVYQDGAVTVSWHDYNGELNSIMKIERKANDGVWTAVADIDLQDGPADYIFVDEEGRDGYSYRVYLKDYNGKERRTSEMMAVHANLQVGDMVNMAGQNLYAGGNILTNGDFDLGKQGWSNGSGTSIGQPDFQIVPIGGYDGGAYLQGWTNQGSATTGGLKKNISISAGKNYYFSVCCKDNGGDYQRASLSSDGAAESSVVLSLPATSKWIKYAASFNSADYTRFLILQRWFGSTAQMDKFELRQLFATREEALADGVSMARQRVNAIRTFNTKYSYLNTELQQKVSAASGTDEEVLQQINEAITTTMGAIRNRERLDSLLNYARTLVDCNLLGVEELQAQVETAAGLKTADAIATGIESLQQAINEYLPMYDATDMIQNPTFEKATGWSVAGTYTGGEQTVKKQFGQSCWNAWWGGISASEGTAKTMAVEQKIADLPMGYYALQCKALTQHYCLSDQHAYIAVNDDVQESPALTFDRLDLPSATADNVWQTLATAPVYVGPKDTLVIGFAGSKKGAVDYAWRSYGNVDSNGDRREGWWCATDFRLSRLPVYIREVEPGSWGTICLPFNIKPSADFTLYKIAGVNAEKTKVFLEEVTEPQPGVPYIYQSAVSKLAFFGGEDASLKPVVPAGIMAMFESTDVAKVPNRSCYLQDGRWLTATTVIRPHFDSYTFVISRLASLTVLESWDGAWLPIGDYTDGIEAVKAETSSDVDANAYTLGGVKTKPTRPGIYIMDGKKVIKK